MDAVRQSDDPSHVPLTIHAVGPAAEGGTLPLAELARIAGGFQASLDRLALAIHGRKVGPGRRAGEIVDAVQLDIVALTAGSVRLAVAKTGQGELLGDQTLEVTLGALSKGIHQIIRDPSRLPANFTPPLVNGLRDLAGGIAPGRLSRIDFLRSGEPLFTIDEGFRQALKELDVGISTGSATVVGRLHMGDFSPASLRCRIDTLAGSVLCDFDLVLKDAVLDAMDRMVMAQGTAQIQPDGSTIRTLHLTGIHALHSASPKSLDELAAEQGIGPVTSAEDLAGQPIPDEDFEVFAAAIASARSEDE